MEFPDFYLGGIFIFVPKNAIFTIFWGGTRKRRKNIKKLKNKNSAAIKFGELNKGKFHIHTMIHALVASNEIIFKIFKNFLGSYFVYFRVNCLKYVNGQCNLTNKWTKLVNGLK